MAVAAAYRLRRAVFSPLYVGPLITTVRSSRAFTSCARLHPANAIQRFLSCSQVARSYSIWRVGRRSRRYFMPSRSLRHWALIPPMRHQSIGTIFTTALASTRRLGLTPIHSTRLGSGAKESHCEQTRDHSDYIGSERCCTAFDELEAAPMVGLECNRQHADRALPSRSNRHLRRGRPGHRYPARAHRLISCGSWISSSRRSPHQACPCPLSANRLSFRTRHYGRGLCNGNRSRLRSTWSAST